MEFTPKQRKTLAAIVDTFVASVPRDDDPTGFFAVKGSDVGADVAADQLWFRHVSTNLEIGVIGTSDKLTIQNWYNGSANHIERIETAQGSVLLDTQVENLVSAMAAFAPPAAGQTTLPQSYQDALHPVIAANWQPQK